MKRHPLPASFHASLDQLRASTRPIVVGPWMSEIGYELLYWIPFLAWVQEAYQLDPSRFVVLSRGGCQAWYAHIASQYYDIFSWYTPERFAAENVFRIRTSPRKSIKQQTVCRFEYDLLQRIRRKVGDCEWLHPSLMYRAFWTWRPWTAKWQMQAKHQPFLPVTPLEGLPARYVAVRFYTSSICPERQETRDLMTELVRDLILDSDVVLLNSGHQYDDHREVTFPTLQSARLHRLDGRMTPATNLEVQTRVIAGASSFVGTYGGFAYLAPLLGVNAETVYGHRASLSKLAHHLTLARQIFKSNPKFGWLTVNALHEPREAYA